MRKLLPLVLLILLVPSTAHAAPITVMRFSGAITSVASDFTNFLPEGMDVGTWFVGSLWIDDEPAVSRFVNFDLTIGTHHITAHSANGWSNEDEDYQSMYGNWPGLQGGYVDPIVLFGASGPLRRQLHVYVVGPGIAPNPEGWWYTSGVFGTVYNVPEPSTMLLLATGSVVMFMRKKKQAGEA